MREVGTPESDTRATMREGGTTGRDVPMTMRAGGTAGRGARPTTHADDPTEHDACTAVREGRAPTPAGGA